MIHDPHLDDLAAFVMASPSSFHAAAEAARRLEAAGFKELRESEDWQLEPEHAGHGRFFVVRDGSIIAWIPPGDPAGDHRTHDDRTHDSSSHEHGRHSQGRHDPAAGFRIVGAHTDSPGFRLKPKPSTAAHGWLQAGVEVYGGPLLNSWLDRELEFAGRLVFSDRSVSLVRTGPIARFAQLAIHLDRAVSAEGLRLDTQTHLSPIVGLGAAGDHDLVDLLARAVGRTGADVLGFDIALADTQPPAQFGIDSALFASPRLDNLSSVHSGLTAIIRLAGQFALPSSAFRPEASASVPEASASVPEASASVPQSLAPVPESSAHLRQTVVFAAFDHEEVGSSTRSGAGGPFLEEILNRITGSSDPAVRARAAAASWLLSADAGHAVHPNYPERHDPANRPVAGGGPLLKINANQRYATDALGAAEWALACENAGVSYQEFVSHNAIPCGSTIGPIASTRLGIRTVDVGLAVLSMHSARELCGADDPRAFTAAIESFLLPRE